MSEASRLAASTVHHCMLVSWALLLHTLPYFISTVCVIFRISAFACAWLASDCAVYCHIFSAMSTSASYMVCSILPCAMGIAALYHGPASCIACCRQPWALPCAMSAASSCVVS